jgi:glycosyltransferase involved in cell wall biosynthesis
MPDAIKTTILRPEVIEHVERLGSAEIVVGIPSYNNARTIGHVARAIGTGLAKYFPDRRAVLVNSDGGSVDGTPDVVAGLSLGATEAILVRQPARPVERIVTAYQGIPGKGSAFRTVFEIASRLEARACAVVDSDLRSITPEWLELLLAPVLAGDYDYVAPLYSRHKYDGTITNSIVYPLVRALYGRRIRQPIGGDFGFSGRLARHYLGFDVWNSDVARFGIDIWMTTTALVGDFRVCQAYLGAKLHDAKDPEAHLSAMLSQVASALFSQVEEHAGTWLEVNGSKPVPEFGFRYDVGLDPIPVDVGRMVRAFQIGVKEFDGLYAQVLDDATRGALRDLATASTETFHMPPDVWVRVVYGFLLAYRRRSPNPAHLLPCLTPLYLGRTASWVNQASGYGAEAVERALDELCERFEAFKPTFVEAWTEGRKLA